ncbi:6625_t:CDS:2, partial [Racocetra persica]
KAAIISITSLNLKHNHPLNSMTNSYATKNRTLPEAVIQEIRFYMAQGNLSTIIQCRLLSAKFPEITIYLHDVESENSVIKSILQGHPSLCELAAILDLRLCDEARYINYNEWYYANANMKLRQLLYYYTVMESDELPASESSKEKYNTQQIYLNSLCSILSYNTIPKHWYKNEKMQDLCLDEQPYIKNNGIAQLIEGCLPCPNFFLCARLPSSIVMMFLVLKFAMQFRNDMIMEKLLILLRRRFEQRLTNINNNNKKDFDPNQEDLRLNGLKVALNKLKAKSLLRKTNMANMGSWALCTNLQEL